MEPHEMEARIKNVDERTQRIEQILPTVATKEDVKAIREEMKTLVKSEVREEGERTRRHFDVVAEQLRGDIALIAEGHKATGARIDSVVVDLKADIANHDVRITRLEAPRRR